MNKNVRMLEIVRERERERERESNNLRECNGKQEKLFNIHHSLFTATIRSHHGITLIALIITIILLLILAGVTIHFTIGENGILKNAEIAGNKYKEAGENETNLLDQAYAYMNGETLQPNTPETTAGTPVQMPNNWYIETPTIYVMPEAKEIEKSKRTASVYAVSDGLNNTIPIPKGFYYVGGNLDSGVVISDNIKDQNKYKDEANGIVPSGVKVVEVEEKGTKVKKLESELQGNQFVWIPCKEEEYHKTNWGQGNTNYSNCYWSAQTNSYEINQVKKYGGFYVGRYEAGLPNETDEFKDNQVYYSDIYNFYGIPQSKAGLLPWNFINWEKSQSNARKMYENNESVSSGLITGTRVGCNDKQNCERRFNKEFNRFKNMGKLWIFRYI